MCIMNSVNFMSVHDSIDCDVLKTIKYRYEDSRATNTNEFFNP
jgi:hypothetical protein